MLKDYYVAEKPDEGTVRERVKLEGARLADFQLKIREAKLPVMVIFEGWGAAGKGAVLASVIKNIDPRFFAVATLDHTPSAEEKRYPFLWRYIREIPEAGKFRFFDTCWMEEVANGIFSGELSREMYEERIESIQTIERQLSDHGYLVVKFFFHIGEKAGDGQTCLRKPDPTDPAAPGRNTGGPEDFLPLCRAPGRRRCDPGAQRYGYGKIHRHRLFPDGIPGGERLPAPSGGGTGASRRSHPRRGHPGKAAGPCAGGQ